MKNLLSILILILPFYVCGQQLLFKGDLVDTLWIKAESDYFDDTTAEEKEILTGKRETFIVAFDQNRNKYTIHEHARIMYQHDTKSIMDSDSVWSISADTVYREKENLLKRNKGRINETALRNILEGFEASSSPLSFHEQIDTSKFKKYIPKWYFEASVDFHQCTKKYYQKYPTKRDRNKFITSCRTLDSLKSYISFYLDKEQAKGFNQYFEVRIRGRKRDYSFELRTYNPVNQEWNQYEYYLGVDYDDLSEFRPISILNFKIHQGLSDLLPEDFYLLYYISTEQFYDSYIDWFVVKNLW